MKYYKIVDPAGHNGMVYKEGLNIDILSFNPSGDCEPGGIYFAKEHIFAFCEYGTEVYEVEPVGRIYENPGVCPKKFKAHQVNLKYVGKLWDIKTLKILLDDGADIHADDDYALRWGSYMGHFEVVKFLVENGANIHAENDDALRWAKTQEIRYYLNSIIDKK
jgi:hypothetical protein